MPNGEKVKGVEAGYVGFYYSKEERQELLEMAESRLSILLAPIPLESVKEELMALLISKSTQGNLPDS